VPIYRASRAGLELNLSPVRRDAGGAQHVVSVPSDNAPVTPVLNPHPSPVGSGPLRKAAELFRADTSNCRIGCAASRHGSPAAFLDEGAPVPR